MKIARWALGGLGIVFLILQFIRPDRTAGPANTEQSIAALYHVDEEVSGILRKACFDCHSNDTRYPWYTEVQPVGWYLQGHIDEARKHLNFDEFGSYPLFRQMSKLQAVEDEVRDELMPLDEYLPLHPEARLTPEERESIIAWSRSVRDSMRAWYPADSLQRRRRTSRSE